MKPSYKPPLKRKYFHTERRLETKDAAFLKKKIELLNQKKLKINIGARAMRAYEKENCISRTTI